MHPEGATEAPVSFDRVVDDIAAEVAAGWRAWQQAEQQRWAQWKAIVQEAAQAHGEALALLEKGDGRGYAALVEAQVLRPLQQAWHAKVLPERIQPTPSLEALGPERWPEQVRVPLAPELFVDEAEAWVGRRLRCRIARRVVTLWNRRGPRRPCRRTVPLRHLLAFHLEVRVPRAWWPVYEACRAHWARAVGLVEEGLAAWQETVRTALPLDAAIPSAEVLEGARALQEVLGAAIQEPLPDLSIPEASLSKELVRDLERAGTFLLRRRHRRLPRKKRRYHSRWERIENAWQQWFRQAADRAALLAALVQVACQLRAQQDRLADRLEQAIRTPRARVAEQFSSYFDRVRERLAQALAEGADDPERLRPHLQEALAARAALRRLLYQQPDLRQLSTVLDAPARDEWAAVTTTVQTLPEQCVLHPAGRTLRPEGPVLTIPLRALVLEHLEPPWPERLEAASLRLRQAVLKSWSALEEVLEIVGYNLEAALDEIKAEASGGDLRARLEELALGSLQHAERRLEESTRELEEALRAFRDALAEQIRSDWRALEQRLQAEMAQRAQWKRLRLRLQHQAGQWLYLAHQQGKRLWKTLQAASRRTLRRVRQLVRRGQAAIGMGADSGAIDQVRAADVLLSIEEVRARLPLIYRRLFTFEPLDDPTLFVGFDLERRQIAGWYGRWREGRSSSAVVLTAFPGAGLTSMLNVLATTVFAEAHVCRLTLQERVLDEAHLAALLVQALQLPESPDTLEAVETAIGQRFSREKPTVVLVDNLEHVLLCTYNGQQVLERLLILFARTDQHVFWVAGIARPAWFFFERTARNAVGLVQVCPLQEPNRMLLEQAIEARHLRSGLPLRFDPPARPSPVLRQRLRRASTPEAQQAILREVFFDRLYQEAGPNWRLALLYWLRSVQVEDGGLRVRPIAALTFDFLEQLSLEQAFTLKAFLRHRTLTLEEHQQLFRSTPAQSLFVLESLLNQRLITPQKELETQREGLQPGVRYRLVPFFVQPVRRALQARHILYEG